MTNSEEPTFIGVWEEVGARRKTLWHFSADDKSWSYDLEEGILRVSHVNQRNDVYCVRRLTNATAMLVDIVDHRVTILAR